MLCVLSVGCDLHSILPCFFSLPSSLVIALLPRALRAGLLYSTFVRLWSPSFTATLMHMFQYQSAELYALRMLYRPDECMLFSAARIVGILVMNHEGCLRNVIYRYLRRRYLVTQAEACRGRNCAHMRGSAHVCVFLHSCNCSCRHFGFHQHLGNRFSASAVLRQFAIVKTILFVDVHFSEVTSSMLFTPLSSKHLIGP